MNSSKSTNLIGYIRFNAFVQATNKFTETKGSSGLSPEMYCSASGAGKVAFASRYRRLRLHGTRCCLHSHLFYRHRTIRKLYIDLYHAIKLDKTHHWKEQTKISKWTNCRVIHPSFASAINLKIAIIIRFCMADELNGQALPIHHTNPHKKYNF